MNQSHPTRHSSTVHNGWILRRLPYLEGTALILSGTIGAGILGIPFVISQVGVGIGLICIILIGFLTFGLNLLIAEIACSTKRPLQLVGLAREYLGRPGEIIMGIIMYSMLFGTLLIYLIGEGDTLAALFGGDPAGWALAFFLLATAFVVVGMKTIKIVEMILLFGIFLVVALIAGLGFPHVQFSNLTSAMPANILVLYSVLIFAFHGTTSIPEAHSILNKKVKIFKRSIFTASLVCIILYAIFSLIVVGVTGADTTPIATIGLGFKIGPIAQALANIFAVLTMATGFLMGASAVRDSMKWDFRLPHISAALFVCTIPAVFYFLGVRQFILVMDLVGGIFVSLELLLMIVIYWRARHLGRVTPRGKFLHHALLASGALFVALIIGTVYNVMKYL